MEYWYEILAIISWILSTFLIIFFRKFYKSCSRIIAFFTLKILIDWFIFEGIVKFPGDGDSFKCRIMADCVYLMFTNIIYIQVFFSDYKLDPAFFGISLALTIMSAIIGIFFTMQSDWDKTSLCLVPLIEHGISMYLFVEKTISLFKSDFYTGYFKVLLLVSIIIKIIGNNILRCSYFYIFQYDFLFYISQIVLNIFLVFFFMFYRRINVTHFNLFSVSNKSRSMEKRLSITSRETNYTFQNAAVELMFPADNELNTISECSSINSNLSLDMQNTTTPRDMKVYTVSEEVQKKKSSRLSKISRNLNKVGSEDTTSNRSSNRV